MEQIVKPKSLGGFVQSLSGLFITPKNPQGLTPKEIAILSALLFILKKRNTTEVTKVIKEELAEITSHNFQVTTNYLNKFKKKGVLLDNNRIHSLFFKDKITIQYGEDLL